MSFGDPDIPYRTTPDLVASTAPVFDKDDADHGTLIAVYNDLKMVMDEIDKWHAFDLKGKDGETGLTVEQQIVAHAKAYEMVEPAFSAIANAIAKTDEKFKNRSQ